MTIGHDIADAFERIYYPVDLAHEFAHAGVARAFGGRHELTRRHDGRLGIDVEFDDGTPLLGLIMTALAPTLIGVPLAIILIDGLADALTGTSGLLEGVVSVVAFSLAVRFAWPSVADIAVPIGLLSDQLGGGLTVRHHIAAFLIATAIVASVVLYSMIDGSIGGFAWHHLVGLAVVGWVGYLFYAEWRHVEHPALDE